MNQQDKFFSVVSDGIKRELFSIECANQGLRSTPKALFIKGKKVGVQKYIRIRNRIASFIYDGGMPIIPIEDPKQLNLFP